MIIKGIVAKVSDVANGPIMGKVTRRICSIFSGVAVSGLSGG